MKKTDCSKKILVVDDCEDLVEWLTFDLESRQYLVKSALSGENCLLAILKDNFDYIILDVMMPGMSPFLEFFSTHSEYIDAKLLLPVESIYFLKNDYHIFLEKVLSDKELSSLHEENDTKHLSVKKLVRFCQNNSLLKEYGTLYIHFDGYTVCQILKSIPRYRNSPEVLIFTAGGASREEEERKTLESGASAYFLKSEYNKGLLSFLGADNIKIEQNAKLKIEF